MVAVRIFARIWLNATLGVAAEIMIWTAEPTFLQYLAKTIVERMSRAFREQ